MVNKKKLLSDLINLIVVLFITITISKFILTFIQNEILNIVVVFTGSMITLWTFFNVRSKKNSIGQFISNKLIKEETAKISILKIFLLVIILDFIYSIVKFIFRL